MVGDRPGVDLPQVVRGLIEARAGDAVFVVPDLRIVLGTTTAYLPVAAARTSERRVAPQRRACGVAPGFG
jgi:hypothetical protein